MKQVFDLQQLTPKGIQEQRAQLTAWLTLMIALVLGSITLIRPLFATMHTLFLVSGVVNTSLLLILWHILRRGYWQAQAPALLMALCIYMAFPLILLSGGPNSHYSPIIPLFPFIGLLLGTFRMALFALVFWSIAWIVMAWMLLHGQLPHDLTLDPPNLAKTVSRTLWLIGASVISLMFAVQFDNRSRQLRDFLLELVESDPLTGVGNRRRMDMVLQRELSDHHRRHQWLCLMLVDVDYFKRYNDSRGHAAGDIALREVANCLQNCLNSHIDPANATLARYGGEEFVLIIHNCDPVFAAQAAEQVRKTVQSCQLGYRDNQPDVLTVTVGFACIREREKHSASSLFERADRALYVGKHAGRNRVMDADRIWTKPHYQSDDNPTSRISPPECDSSGECSDDERSRVALSGH